MLKVGERTAVQLPFKCQSLQDTYAFVSTFRKAKEKQRNRTLEVPVPAQMYVAHQGHREEWSLIFDLPLYQDQRQNHWIGSEGYARVQRPEHQAHEGQKLVGKAELQGREDHSREAEGRDSFDRDEHIANINPQDIGIMQQGMLRVLAMLMIECSQLLMRHPFFQPPHERDNDDNLLMQTSMLKKEEKRKDNFEEEVLDMANEENTVRAEREARDKQQEEEEAWQEKCIFEEDEAAWKQWESHQAQRYREWEQWAVLNSVPGEGTKKRLRVTTQRNGHLQQTDMEVAVGSEVSIYLGPLIPSSASQSSWEAPNLDVDTILNNMYDLWKKGKIGDDIVISLAGIDVLGLYNAQLHKEVETMDTVQDQDKDSSGSTK
ncbi:unnamed protein product [Symbiodinium necroappetens]|uniref:Uncharacterized protein n=1 Tax=Symbiodinium necroappetens TaxID=1628268 RepID=A0A813AB90_9DINO|nr:unnamed protein product [Symbiodinium necroappetens]